MAKAATPTSPADKPGEDQNAGSNAGAASVTPGAENGTGAGAAGDGDGDGDGGPEMQQPILVRSVAAKGRWRIGRHFTQEPILLDAAELDDDQKALLAGDPELIIQVVD